MDVGFLITSGELNGFRHETRRFVILGAGSRGRPRHCVPGGWRRGFGMLGVLGVRPLVRKLDA